MISKVRSVVDKPPEFLVGDAFSDTGTTNVQEQTLGNEAQTQRPAQQGNMEIQPPLTEKQQQQQDINPMEQVLPLATWKTMRQDEREQFLDQFYPIRDRFRIIRETDEQCASEALALFMCRKEENSSRWQSMKRMWDTNKTWEERMEPCAGLMREQKRCLILIGTAARAKKVFGQHANPYIRVVDEETRTDLK